MVGQLELCLQDRRLAHLRPHLSMKHSRLDQRQAAREFASLVCLEVWHFAPYDYDSSSRCLSLSFCIESEHGENSSWTMVVVDDMQEYRPPWSSTRIR